MTTSERQAFEAMRVAVSSTLKNRNTILDPMIEALLKAALALAEWAEKEEA